jgi:hypothetical protein
MWKEICTTLETDETFIGAYQKIGQDWDSKRHNQVMVYTFAPLFP